MNETRRLLSHEEAKWAHEKWCTGYTINEIASALYCNPRTLTREFQRRGWRKVRPKLKFKITPESPCVVRCRDCSIPHNEWTGCPKLGGLITTPDFYCAYGRRNQNETEPLSPHHRRGHA